MESVYSPLLDLGHPELDGRESEASRSKNYRTRGIGNANANIYVAPTTLELMET